MDVSEAIDAWQAQYSGQPPVGFMLRFTHEAVWTRVHYLRDSAGPATREEDQRTATKFDAVASALFTGTTVLVLAIHLDPGHEATDELMAIGAKPVDPPSGWTEGLREYLPASASAEFVATTMSWQRGCLDPVWLAVARDRIGRVAVFAPATGDAFCPYGGGADVFVWGSDRRSKLGDRFRAWVPGTTPMPGPSVRRRTGDLIVERG
jgi:hypothetical protein